MTKKAIDYDKEGFEAETGIKNVPVSVRPYLCAAFGVEKEVDRLLSFKVGNVCRNQIMNLIQRMTENCVRAGMQYQKELDYSAMLAMQKQVERCRKD